MRSAARLVTALLVLSTPPLFAQQVANAQMQIASGQIGGDLSETAPRFFAALKPVPIQVDIARTPILQRRIALDLRGVTLARALQVIGDSSGLSFAYSRAEVPVDKRVRLQAADITVAAALTEVLLSTNVDVAFTERGKAMLVRRSPSPARITNGVITGTVSDAKTGERLSGTSVQLVGTQLGATSRADGRYSVTAPPGHYLLRARKLGYDMTSDSIVVTDGGTVTRDLRLQPSAALLGKVVVTSQRLGETQAAALERREQAPNVVNVLSGDVIRALPNANPAEAAARIPGVSTERDEGEGKYIQIRGTQPSLSNVTIDGAHVPGTEGGSRVPKLDDIPSDILGSIEVSKTLTADMDADAIGGTVNLVTKTPEGTPKGYISGQYGRISLLSKNQYQEGFAYGGRFGTDRKLGFLIGGSVDRNNRTSNDLEPSWVVDSTGRSVPNDFSERDYVYARTRYGLGADVDYRFDNGSAVSLKGLYSKFQDFGTTYINDVSTGATGSTFGAIGDSAGIGSHGYGTGAEATREGAARSPGEQLYGVTFGGNTRWRDVTAKLTLNAAGTLSHSQFINSPFVYDGPEGQGLTVAYDASNTKVPTYQFVDQGTTTAASTPANFALSRYTRLNRHTRGRDLGTALDLSTPWHTDNGGWSAVFKFGGKIRDAHRVYVLGTTRWGTSTPLSLQQVLGNFSDPNYYSSASNAFTLGPMPDEPAILKYEATNASSFINRTNTASNALGSFDGSERIYAAYLSNTLNAGPIEIYLGLRMESTHSNYTGHAIISDTSGAVTGTRAIPGSQTYTDLFPSLQLKYTFAPGTDARAAVTRGIARPDYSQLAPSFQGTLNGGRSNPGNVSTGNPDLKPQHAWNYDFLVEHYYQSVGVISGGAFYKSLTDFIFDQTFTYNGPVSEFDGYLGTRPENGGSGHILGFEAEWTQRLVFLPGALAGLGFDANFTHVDSHGLIDPIAGRYGPLPQQSPNLGNFALTYDYGSVSARAGWNYQGANIDSYGDGTPTPNGDTYYYAHSQVDASIIYNFNPRVQVQLQGLNLNNAVFGLFSGTPSHDYSVQREYYGSTIYLGAKFNI